MTEGTPSGPSREQRPRGDQKEQERQNGRGGKRESRETKGGGVSAPQSRRGRQTEDCKDRQGDTDRGREPRHGGAAPCSSWARVWGLFQESRSDPTAALSQGAAIAEEAACLCIGLPGPCCLSHPPGEGICLLERQADGQPPPPAQLPTRQSPKGTAVSSSGIPPAQSNASATLGYPSHLSFPSVTKRRERNRKKQSPESPLGRDRPLRGRPPLAPFASATHSRLWPLKAVDVTHVRTCRQKVEALRRTLARAGAQSISPPSPWAPAGRVSTAACRASQQLGPGAQDCRGVDRVTGGQGRLRGVSVLALRGSGRGVLWVGASARVHV